MKTGVTLDEIEIKDLEAAIVQQGDVVRAAKAAKSESVPAEVRVLLDLKAKLVAARTTGTGTGGGDEGEKEKEKEKEEKKKSYQKSGVSYADYCTLP